MVKRSGLPLDVYGVKAFIIIHLRAGNGRKIALNWTVLYKKNIFYDYFIYKTV